MGIYRPFYAVLELIDVVAIGVVVAVVDIAAPPHVATRSLDEISVRVSIVVVAAVELGRSGDLDDATASIAYLAR